MKILIIKTGALGDIIISSTFFQTVKENFKEDEIYLLTQKIYKELTETCPVFERIFYLPEKFNILGFLKLILKLRRGKFDIIFDIQGNLKTNFWTFLFGGKKRYGFYRLKVGRIFLTKGIRKGERIDPVNGVLSILKFLKIEKYIRKMKIWIPEEERIKFKEFLKDCGIDENKKIIVIHPLSGSGWITRRWLKENYAQLSDKLIEDGYIVIFIGSGEDDYVNDIISKMKNKPVNLINKTNLYQLSLLLEKSSLLITGDSGPLHIGVASGTKVLGIFGPSDPVIHLPPDTYYIYKKVDCSPCHKKICKSMKCMKEIKVEEVYKKIKEILENGRCLNNNPKL